MISEGIDQIPLKTPSSRCHNLELIGGAINQGPYGQTQATTTTHTNFQTLHRLPGKQRIGSAVRRISGGVVGNHAEFPYPFDLALLPVDMKAWADATNQSKAIQVE